MIESTPVTASDPNHRSMTGPKYRLTLCVPERWIRNSPSRIPQASGSTYCSSCAFSTCMPSTALSTEMAGVMAASQ